jgi:hypothetical protein
MRGQIKYTSAGRAAREPDLVLRYPPQPGPRAVPARGGRLRLFRVYSSLPTANRLS